MRCDALELPVFIDGAGRPLVLLGGGVTGAAGFAPHARELARDFEVIRLQTLNLHCAQRRVTLPRGYSIKTESGAMKTALDRLRLIGPLDIAGHSLGALVGLDFALDHPERVRTLTLSEPPAFWIVPRDEFNARSQMNEMAELVRTFRADREPTDEQLVSFLKALGDHDARPPLGDSIASAAWNERRAALRGLAAVPNHRDHAERCKRLQCSVLVITSENAPAFHRRINEILLTLLPFAEHAWLPGGHGAVITAPDLFVARLREFLGITADARETFLQPHNAAR
jgi:pimeloyl-ACP methyl ester carboxylesterase